GADDPAGAVARDGGELARQVGDEEGPAAGDRAPGPFEFLPHVEHEQVVSAGRRIAEVAGRGGGGGTQAPGPMPPARENAEERPGPARAWREARRALLWEHLLTWVPVYAQAASALPATFASAWARLLRRAVLGEAQALAPPSATPLHLRDVPELPDSDSSSFLRPPLAPAPHRLPITPPP